MSREYRGIMSRLIAVSYSCLISLLLIGFAGKAVPGQTVALSKTIAVPFDYRSPRLGTGSIYFEFGAAYNKQKPTVFIIADAQQFYVRRGEVANLQRSLFGDDFNVIGIVGRGTSQDFIRATLDANGKPNWVRAWQVFNSEQWINDIETVRRRVVGEKGKILLYGRSGGAFLIHQYLTKYGRHVLRAYTQAALNPFLIKELGLNSDHFWEELGAQDPELQTTLKSVLQRRASDRETIIMMLQRQNFFVPLEQLAAARADLIRAFAADDSARFEEARKEYQVDLIQKINDSPEGISARVRIYEFFYPSNARQKLSGNGIYPDLENQYNVAKPLVMLANAGKIPSPGFDFAALHRLETEVFILAGRWDHTADYRSSIALAQNYPHHFLFIADDNHTFQKMGSGGHTLRILRTFLKSGIASAKTRDALRAAEPLRWTE